MSSHIQVNNNSTLNQSIDIFKNCDCTNCTIPFEIWLSIGEELIKNNIVEDRNYMNNIKIKNNINEILNVKNFNNIN